MLVQCKDKVKLWKEKGKANNVRGCANGRSSFFTKQRKEKETRIEAATILFTISDLITMWAR